MPDMPKTVTVSIETVRDAALWLDVFLRTIPPSPLASKIGETKDELLRPLVDVAVR